MKTFKELKSGDKIYVVNEGSSVGYIRLEEYILEESLHPSEKVVGTYIAKQKDCTWDLIIHESLLNDSNCGFIFTTFEEALDFYVKKAEEVALKIQKKYNEAYNNIKKIWYDYMDILKNIKNIKEKNYSQITISKQYNEDN